MMHPQKTTLLKGLDNPQFCDRVLKKKRSQNAQPQSKILRSKGFGGAALNKQFVAVDSHKHCLRLYVWLPGQYRIDLRFFLV